MREIRTAGVTRGEEAKAPLLPYRANVLENDPGSLSADIFADVLAEQAIVFVGYDFVAFTADSFEALAIENVDGAAGVLDKSTILQAPGGDGYAFAADTEHVCDQVMRHNQFVRRKLVMVDQQPAT